jgi:hypothetical protein
MVGLRHHQPGNVEADPPVPQQARGGRQLGVQRPGDPEPARTLRGRHPAGQGELVGDAPPDHLRITQHLPVLGGDLGPAERHAQRRLRPRRRGLDPLQQRDRIDPRRVHRDVSLGGLGRSCVGQLAEPG